MLRQAINSLKKSFGLDTAIESAAKESASVATYGSKPAKELLTGAGRTDQAQSLEDVSFHLQHDQPLDQEIIL